MLRILDSASSLGAASREQRCFAPSVWPPLTILRGMSEALREGLAVHRHYEALRSRGVAHDAALRRALAIGAAPSRQMRGTIAPLYFAGRA